MNMHQRLSAEEALQARLGGALAAALSAYSATMPHDLAERLRAGREQAMARARTRPVTAHVSAGAQVVIGRSAGGAALLGGTPSWWLKLASGLPLVVLVLGLLLIERINSQQQVRAAAEIDTLLLADELPPTAYTDPGFGEFLRSPRPDLP